MKLIKLLTWKDIAENRIKKVIFVLLGLSIFIFGIFLGIKLNISNELFVRLYSLFITLIGFVYFIIPVIFLSFNKPIYLFKNKVFSIFFPLLFNWGSFIVYMYFGRTEKIAIISLILVFIGYIFSGIRSDFILNKIAFFIHYFLNYLFSRLFFMLFLIFNLEYLLKIIRIFL